MHSNGYIHADIRWPNVAYHEGSRSYLLIDFENVEEIDENCQHPDKLLIDEIKLGECKCFIRDLYYIRNQICDFSYFSRNDKHIKQLFDSIKSILDIKNKKEWNEAKQQSLFKLLN